MADPTDKPEPQLAQQPVGAASKAAGRDAKAKALASALRDNLRRRKAAQPPKPESSRNGS